MPHQTEPSANSALGTLLQGMLGKATVRSENTQVIEGHAGLQPDILVSATGRSPVVIEAEYDPAQHVEPEATARLGLKVTGQPRTIEAVVALRYPEAVGDSFNLTEAILEATLRYCVFTEEGSGTVRFPESGWLEGSVADVADLVRLVSVPNQAVEQASNALRHGIDRVADLLENLEYGFPGIALSVARLLGMENGLQTRRMAGAIIANAMVFHERIAGIHEGIKPLNLVCGPGISNPHNEIINAWTEILKINYWPIFAIGQDILRQLPSGYAKDILETLQYRVAEVETIGIDNSHDLTGRVFQRLISDRKYLATFYTLPASAALLARLAVAKLEGLDWADSESIGSLRVGDFACGTGALLSAVYEQIASRHESLGGDSAAIHPVMMEQVLYGCDVLPSAVHITGSSLAGQQPTVGFNKSRLYPMAYGRQDDGSVKIGSLELLRSSSVLTLFNTSDPARRTGSVGEETAAQINAEVPDISFDLVIMNPPFTSNTKHYDADDGVVNAAFAAFESSEDDQRDMAKRMGPVTNNTCYHGHAGLASAFAALGDRKVRSGGVVAFVLPFTAINGSSWAKFRELIATKFTDITVVSISANGKDMSFSSDTGMAECLVIARRISGSERPSLRANFVSLSERPAGFAAASEIAKAVLRTEETRRLEDGPYGGSTILIGRIPSW